MNATTANTSTQGHLTGPGAMERYSELITGHSHTVLCGVLAVSVLVLLQNLLFGSRAMRKIPLEGKELGSYPKRIMAFVYNSESLYRGGYKKFQDMIWRMTTVDGM
jgi:hypothetical protein